MITFAAFRKNMLDKIENYRNMANSTSDVHVDKNGYPVAVVYHGEHSKEEKKPKKAAKKVVKESMIGKGKEWLEENDNKHLGEHIEAVHSKLMGTTEGRSPPHQVSLFNYTKSSRNMNKTLYEHHLKGKTPPTKVKMYEFDDDHDGVKHDIPRLDEALNSHKLGHDLHVYSGVHFDVNQVASKHPDRHIHFPAYTSTSIDKTIAQRFAVNNNMNFDSGDPIRPHAHVLHIHLPKGHHGAYMGEESAFSHEREFIMPRNTTLKVHPESTEHTDEDGRKVMVWKAEPVKHETV